MPLRPKADFSVTWRAVQPQARAGDGGDSAGTMKSLEWQLRGAARGEGGGPRALGQIDHFVNVAVDGMDFEFSVLSRQDHRNTVAGREQGRDLAINSSMRGNRQSPSGLNHRQDGLDQKLRKSRLDTGAERRSERHIL